VGRQIRRAAFALVASVGLLWGLGCRTFDRWQVQDAAATYIYYQCRYELLCVSDTSKWKCQVNPPAVRPAPVAGECKMLFDKNEELRWQTQTSEKARADSGKLPALARASLKAAKKAVEAQ